MANTENLPSVQTGRSLSSNPFQRMQSEHINAGTVAIESERAIAEAQAKMIVAQRFPRDEYLAYEKIMTAFSRPMLAAVATYSYPRAGQTITGPSIRAAEEIARCWGNVDYGVRELSRRDGESEMQAYCIDLQTNVHSSQNFTVKHVRDKKGGNQVLTDERDIYEITANMGGRRLRARILAVMPPDLIEQAMDRARKALAGDTAIPLADRIKRMLDRLGKMGVTSALVESRLCHKLDTTTPDELADLTGIFNSLRDNQSSVADWFGQAALAQPEAGSGVAEAVRKQVAAPRPEATAKAEESAPPAAVAPRPSVAQAGPNTRRAAAPVPSAASQGDTAPQTQSAEPQQAPARTDPPAKTESAAPRPAARIRQAAPPEEYSPPPPLPDDDGGRFDGDGDGAFDEDRPVF